MTSKPANHVIEARHISRAFGRGRYRIWAVDDVSFSMEEKHILCLVGESGCGKTTTGKVVAGLLRPTQGQIFFEGQDVAKMNRQQFKQFRRAVQIIHQDPYASLNPAHTVYQILSAPLLRHKLVANRHQARSRCIELLETVDMTPAEDFLDKYPHQLSGGQRQRVSIARCLTVNPKFIVADEAVSMVDVSIRISLLSLLSRLRDELGVAFLFITHDLAIAKFFAWEERIGVMYVGSLVEIARTPQLVNDPQHPYSRALLAAIPEADPLITRSKETISLRSMDIPSLYALPAGCRFHPRCPFFMEGLCDRSRPELMGIQDGRYVACHLYNKSSF